MATDGFEADIPEEIVTQAFARLARPPDSPDLPTEIEARWAEIVVEKPNLRFAIGKLCLEVAPSDPELRGMVAGALIRFYATLEDAHTTSALEAAFTQPAAEVA